MRRSFGNRQSINVCRPWLPSSTVFRSIEWNVVIVSSEECYVSSLSATMRSPVTFAPSKRTTFVCFEQPMVLRKNKTAALM